MAPEMLQKRYDEKADIWSIGVIAYQLIAGRLPFCDANQGDAEIRRLKPEQLEARILAHPIDTWTPKRWACVSEDAKDFLHCLLERDPSRRLSAAQALAHPWISGLKESTKPLKTGIPTELGNLNTRNEAKRGKFMEPAAA
ncbi:hypothetical protein AAMO2058_001057000 [Amorphochlora amoebiformis]